MMKKYCMIWILCFILVLSGCSSLPNHLVKEEGQYFLILDEETIEKERSNDDFGLQMLTSIIFDSLNGMIQDYRTLNFEDWEIDQLVKITSNDGKTPMPDLDHLLSPVLPEEYTAYKVFSCGREYGFKSLSDHTGVQFSMTVLSKGQYDSGIAQIEKYAERNRVEWHSIEDRNAILYTFSTEIYDSETHEQIPKKFYHVVYAVEANGFTYQVDEAYDSLEGCPTMVTIYGCGEEAFFSIILRNLDERPSVEWISQFRLEEYK